MNVKQMVEVIQTAYNCNESDAWKVLDDQRYYAGSKTVNEVHYLGVNSLGHVNLKFIIQ
jgi:hypothetical protein